MLLLKPELVERLDAGGPAAVQEALAQALKLELATIPPYLYAMYSLEPQKNGEIAEQIRTVVKDEMVHMCLE
jgi:hypothetical protein